MTHTQFNTNRNIKQIRYENFNNNFRLHFCNNNRFDFQNQSKGEFTNVEWTFGDGHTTADANGTHTYEKDGEYYFTVTVYNAENGCVDFFADKHIVSSKKAEQAVVSSKKIIASEAAVTNK